MYICNQEYIHILYIYIYAYDETLPFIYHKKRNIKEVRKKCFFSYMEESYVIILIYNSAGIIIV